jgi:hypothetical protein
MMNTVAAATIMKVMVAASERGEKFARPLTRSFAGLSTTKDDGVPRLSRNHRSFREPTKFLRSNSIY